MLSDRPLQLACSCPTFSSPTPKLRLGRRWLSESIGSCDRGRYQVEKTETEIAFVRHRRSQTVSRIPVSITAFSTRAVGAQTRLGPCSDTTRICLLRNLLRRIRSWPIHQRSKGSYPPKTLPLPRLAHALFASGAAPAQSAMVAGPRVF